MKTALRRRLRDDRPTTATPANNNKQMQENIVEFRRPLIRDGQVIWQLVRDSGVLDPNSAYCYLLLCRDFAKTCAVAQAGGKVVGFVTGYLPPGRDDILFVWQVGVSPAFRGQGLAGRMILDILGRDSCRDVRWIETTVSPSNQASRALFASLARRLDAELTESPCFDTADFPEGGHEAEPLLRIGPFDLSDSPQA